MEPAVVPVERGRQTQEEVAGALLNAAIGWHERRQADQYGQGVGGFDDVGGLPVAQPVGDATLLDGDECAKVVAARDRLEAGLGADDAVGLRDRAREADSEDGIQLVRRGSQPGGGHWIGRQRQSRRVGGGPDEVDVAEGIVGVVGVEEDAEPGAEEIGVDPAGGFGGEGSVGGCEPQLVVTGLTRRGLGRTQPVGAGQGLEKAHVQGGGAHADNTIDAADAKGLALRRRGVHVGGGERQGDRDSAWLGG